MNKPLGGGGRPEGRGHSSAASRHRGSGRGTCNLSYQLWHVALAQKAVQNCLAVPAWPVQKAARRWREQRGGRPECRRGLLASACLLATTASPLPCCLLSIRGGGSHQQQSQGGQQDPRARLVRVAASNRLESLSQNATRQSFLSGCSGIPAWTAQVCPLLFCPPAPSALRCCIGLHLGEGGFKKE